MQNNKKTDKNRTNMNRRAFLRSTAAMGASLAFAPQILAQNVNKREENINVALLGAGAQGQVLMNSCLKIPGLRFKAVCDIWKEYNQKRAVRILQAYKHSPTAYVDYREMLDKEKNLDAVIIATPDFCHAEQTIASLEAGLDVYCEKEMSNNLEDAGKMVEAARQSGRLLQIGHQRRSNPRYLHCIDKILGEANILGRITTVNGQWNRSVQPQRGWPKGSDIDSRMLKRFGYESMRQFRNWRWYKGLGGGPIVDLGSHQIDIYNWFLGTYPKNVIASGGTDYYDKDTHQWYDNVMAVYQYETDRGQVRAFYQTITTNSSQGYYENFMGDQGSLVISESAGRGAVYREASAPEWDKWVKKGYLLAPQKKEEENQEGLLDVRETVAPPAYELAVTMKKKYHQPHLENFFDAVRGKAKLNCPAEDAFKTAVTVLKVNDAVRSSKLLTFKDEEFKV